MGGLRGSSSPLYRVQRLSHRLQENYCYYYYYYCYDYYYYKLLERRTLACPPITLHPPFPLKQS